jgi:hypothetical protein
VSLYLCVQSIAARAYEFSLPLNASSAFIFNAVIFVNVNREANLPTWYSTLLLAASSGLIALIASVHRQKRNRFVRRWALLSIVFLYLSLDEAAALHEYLTDPLRELFNVTGYLHFAWVLVGIPFALVIVVLYWQFVWALPKATRNRLILAAVVYLGGALVIEIISANQYAVDEGRSLLYSAIGTLEEFCEMAGVNIFIYALLRYLEDYSGGSIALRFGAVSTQNE